MKRRSFLTTSLFCSLVSTKLSAGAFTWHFGRERECISDYLDRVLEDSEAPTINISHLKPNAVEKGRLFDSQFGDDKFLQGEEKQLAKAVLRRLKRIQKLVGYGNFSFLGFDQALELAKNYPNIDKFSKLEKDFIEKIFFTNAEIYGFYGKKVTPHLTTVVNDKDIVKVPRSGHYLFKGDSLAHYKRLIQDMGPSLILTSGIRGVVKQLTLFLDKCERSDNNLSRASRSLAPPGHSYHGIGDFDVGKVGLGVFNFTNKFAQTTEFRRMRELGYVDIRYTENNQLGVRFEPWHIKVV